MPPELTCPCPCAAEWDCESVPFVAEAGVCAECRSDSYSPQGWSYPTIFSSRGVCEIAFAASMPDITADSIREGEEIRIPVREEQVDVSKHAVVTEEVKVGKRVVKDTKRVTGDVRKEEVKVEQTGDVDVRTRGTGKKSS